VVRGFDTEADGEVILDSIVSQLSRLSEQFSNDTSFERCMRPRVIGKRAIEIWGDDEQIKSKSTRTDDDV